MIVYTPIMIKVSGISSAYMTPISFSVITKLFPMMKNIVSKVFIALSLHFHLL